MTHTDLATAIAAYLRTVAPRARQRTLDITDVVDALAEHAGAVAANPGVTVRTRVHGGYLPNAYKGGESDRVQIDTDASGSTTYHVSRAPAEHTACARGDVLRTWTITAGGALKRAV